MVVTLGIILVFTITLTIAYYIWNRNRKRYYCSICGARLEDTSINKEVNYISKSIEYINNEPKLIETPRNYISDLYWAVFCPNNIHHYYREEVRSGDMW